MTKCPTCDTPVPQERIDAGFPKCIKCSNTQKYMGFMNYAHKTAGEVVILSPDNPENVRLATRAYHRSR